MRLNVAVLAAFATAATALPGWLEGQDVITADDDLVVPGQNPLRYCTADRAKDIVKIETVDLAPNPPVPGAKLEIKATGTVLEPIEDGAYINLVVKYGLIRLINQKADLCEQTEKADLSCPIQKGHLSVTKSVDIPREVPPGKYAVHAEVLTKDDKPITCLDATVTFGGRSFSGEVEL